MNSNFIIYSQTSSSWIPILLSTVKPRYLEFQFLLSTVKPRYIEFQFLLSTVKPRYLEFQFLLPTVKFVILNSNLYYLQSNLVILNSLLFVEHQCSWLSLVPSNRKIHWTTKSKRRSVKSLTQPLGGRSTHAAHTKISTTSYYMYTTWKVSHRRCKDGWQRLTWTRFKCRK